MSIKTVFISAGEVSGDMHGAALAKALKKADPNLEIWGMGGPKMKAAGVHIIADITRFSTIGLIEPLRFLPKFLSTYFTIKQWLDERRPDVFIPIDNQGFHMLILKLTKKLGIKTAYYIAPQEWLWGTEIGGKKVSELTDLILSIFKPEYDFYQKLGAKVAYVGHPLLDTTHPTLSKDAFCLQYSLDASRPIVAIFPGSRKQELNLTAPALFQAAKLIVNQRPDVQVVISVASPHFEPEIKKLCAESGLSATLAEGSINIMSHSNFSLVVSGTVTLEHAILGKPCLVGYQFSPMSYWLIKTFMEKKLSRVTFLSLPNLIVNKEILPEFFQEKLKPQSIADKALEWLNDPHQYQWIHQELAKVQKDLGEPGVLDRAAAEILEGIS